VEGTSTVWRNLATYGQLTAGIEGGVAIRTNSHTPKNMSIRQPMVGYGSAISLQMLRMNGTQQELSREQINPQ
jgi:hypothetical protein